MPTPHQHITQLADHLFRREAGKMVAVLTRLFGTENLQMAEDVVQDTLLLAFNSWPDKGIPANPTAWLYRVARNKAIDKLRYGKYSVDTDPDVLTEKHDQPIPDIDHLWKQELPEDDMLRMMFACCHPRIPKENQVTLILKTLCGFSTLEIAKAFLIAEDTVSKRLYRTKEFFRNERVRLDIPSVNELKKRTDVVLNAIYLLFNEGYNATRSEYLIRRELMDEAMMLCGLIIQNKHTQQPEAYALMALMCFHASRSDSRLTTEGEIILLSKQDRTRWDGQLIAQGNYLMNQAAYGDTVSPYHLEAAIAFEHCTANSFDTTNWKKILEYYDWLCRIAPSPFTAINRAVAIMKVDGPQAALDALQNISGVEKFYLYHAILGEIYIRLHDNASARISLERAIRLTHSAAEKKILQEKLDGKLG